MITIFLLLFVAVIFEGTNCNIVKYPHVNNHGSGGLISNASLIGFDNGCRHRSQYFVTSNVQFPMCMGQTDQDLKNGMSIINLINSRGYLPTCRILHLLLWMSSTTHDRAYTRDYFIDVGANIGSMDFLFTLGTTSVNSALFSCF